MRKLTDDEMKRISLLILKDIKFVCQKLNLSYFLDSGTLLGAIRHNGFIPWDDDIDIAMPRPDYEIFCKEYNNYASENFYVASLYNSKKYPFSFAKVYDRRTKKIELGVYLFNQGLSVDVFPLDGYPSSDIFAHYNKLVSNFNDYASEIAMAFSRYTKNIFNIKRNFRIFLARHILARKKALKVQNFASSIDYNSAENIGCNSIMYYNQSNCRAVKKDCYKPINKQFEDDIFIIPQNYDKILSISYGTEYMIPPPVSKRKSTHNIVIYYR